MVCSFGLNLFSADRARDCIGFIFWHDSFCSCDISPDRPGCYDFGNRPTVSSVVAPKHDRIIGMKVLTPTEQLLVEYCGEERQALALAPLVRLSPDATQQDVENAVILALVFAKQAISGPAPQLEYISGQRRDIIRKQLCQ
jgi:hypothetical protein